MSDKDIWMPVYIGDYLADTQLLTTEQHGAYWLLLLAYWKNGGPLPDNDQILMSVCKLSRSKWKKNKQIMLKFFTQKNGQIVHSRVDKELQRAAEKQRKASKKAKNAAKARWSKNATSNATSNASHSHSHITNITVPYRETNHSYVQSEVAAIQEEEKWN